MTGILRGEVTWPAAAFRGRDPRLSWAERAALTAVARLLSGSRTTANRGVQVVQAVPFTEKLVGDASLLVNVPVKPIVTDPAGAMEASYDSGVTVTFSPDWV